ncbi:defensin-like protein [Capsicum annuum]
MVLTIIILPTFLSSFICVKTKMMGRSMPMFATLVILLMVLFATEMKPAEARSCESASQRFNGYCVRSSNCASICSTEGFTDGKCKGTIRRHCTCIRNC